MPTANPVSLTSDASPTLERQFEQSDIYAFAKFCNNPKWQPFITGKYVPCRQCYNCRYTKKLMWQHRMVKESTKWARTFFVTLTYRNTDDHTYGTVQRYLKRVRRNTPDTLRYVATTEYESSGDRPHNPHHHLLIYGTHTLQTRHLTLKWKHGLTQAKLCRRIDTSQNINNGNGSTTRRIPANYVAKYIIKQGERVRASNGIGNNSDPQYPPFLSAYWIARVISTK